MYQLLIAISTMLLTQLILRTFRLLLLTCVIICTSVHTVDYFILFNAGIIKAWLRTDEQERLE